jgi:hypothetical protein
LPFHLGAELAHEMIGKEQHVLAPLAERGQMNPEHRDTIVQVFAEPALGDRTLEVAVGGGNETDVGLERRSAADPLVLPFLQDAKQLGLHGRRELADLVEEERAAGRELEAPSLELVGPGEGAALVAEELRLDQRLWQRRAVERDEATRGPRAGVMDRPGQDFLAGAALAGEEHRRGGGRDLSGVVDGRDEPRGPPDDRVEPESVLERGSRPRRMPLELSTCTALPRSKRDATHT